MPGIVLLVRIGRCSRSLHGTNSFGSIPSMETVGREGKRWSDHSKLLEAVQHFSVFLGSVSNDRAFNDEKFRRSKESEIATCCPAEQNKLNKKSRNARIFVQDPARSQAESRPFDFHEKCPWCYRAAARMEFAQTAFLGQDGKNPSPLSGDTVQITPGARCNLRLRMRARPGARSTLSRIAAAGNEGVPFRIPRRHRARNRCRPWASIGCVGRTRLCQKSKVGSKIRTEGFGKPGGPSHRRPFFSGPRGTRHPAKKPVPLPDFDLNFRILRVGFAPRRN